MKPWARIGDDHADHPKIVAAGWIGETLHKRSINHCNRFLTDGFIDATAVPRLLAGLVETFRALGYDPHAVEQTDWAAHMVQHRLWDAVRGGGFMVHNYLEYQTPKAEVEQLTAKRQKAGRKGANRRWDGKPDSKRDGKPDSKRLAAVRQDAGRKGATGRWGKADPQADPGMATGMARAMAPAIDPPMANAMANGWQPVGGGAGVGGGEGAGESEATAPVRNQRGKKLQGRGVLNARGSLPPISTEPDPAEQVAIIAAEFHSAHPDWTLAQCDDAAALEYRRRHTPHDPLVALNATIARLMAENPSLSRQQAEDQLTKQMRADDRTAKHKTPERRP